MGEEEKKSSSGSYYGVEQIQCKVKNVDVVRSLYKETENKKNRRRKIRLNIRLG